MDHLAFAVLSREDLDSWARRLEELGVRFSSIAASLSIPGAAVIVFRDPDNVELELFANPEQSAHRPVGDAHKTTVHGGVLGA